MGISGLISMWKIASSRTSLQKRTVPTSSKIVVGVEALCY
jgi:hypothetical protein